MSASAEPRRPATVVLVNYRSIHDIERLLRSGAVKRHDVIVVDNGDEPDTIRRICSEHGATAICLEANLGFAAGVNHAVASIDTPTRPWLLLNPDTEVSAEQVDLLLSRLDGGVDGCAPQLALPNGELQPGIAGGPLTLWRVLAYFLFVSRVWPPVRGVFFTSRQARRGGMASWLCMACLALQPDAFMRFGPIPEDQLVYAEDIAWGTAATTRGAQFELCPDITVTHAQGSSGSSSLWIAALEALCIRRLGSVRGHIAVAGIRIGLHLRRRLGHRVD